MILSITVVAAGPSEESVTEELYEYATRMMQSGYGVSVRSERKWNNGDGCARGCEHKGELNLLVNDEPTFAGPIRMIEWTTGE